MLDVDQPAQKERPSSLTQWVYHAIGQPGVSLRVRLRGNNLHILCESRQSLEAKVVVNRLIKALKVHETGEPFPIDPGNPIYQIIIYGRTLGQPRPDWIEPIRLKSPLTQDAKAATTSVEAATSDLAINVSNESLARSGSPEAIARYLSESLSSLGVSVKVLFQELRGGAGERGKEGEEETGRVSSPHSAVPVSSSQSQTPLNQRLWVICNSNYSPDPSLLAEPVVQQLRSLQLKGFRDAAICSQVSGEAAPEWMLRVDLTPPEAMLQEWARWGDVQAIARILNQALVAASLEVRAVQKDATLHLFCSSLAGKETAAPDKQAAANAIAPVLDAIAPQGIQAATIYGVESHPHLRTPEQETPVWIEWLNLPAAKNVALSESAYSLAQKESIEALTFLLERLLNPDLDRRLATGGIHLKIRRKQDLLHIMSEAPICPLQAQIGPPIARFLRQLTLPHIAGARIYGRRAGSTSPAWNYGVDFVQRKRLVPEATPEFAASDAYINDLVAPPGQPILRPDLTKKDVKEGLNQTVQATIVTLQRWLCYSQLFVPAVENQDRATVTRTPSSKQFSSSLGVKVAIVWGTLGLLLTLQADWLMGHLLQSQAKALSSAGTEETPAEVSLPQVSLQKSTSKRSNNFNASGFTTRGERRVIINQGTADSLAPEKARAASAAIIAAARSPKPSFNNPLLDEKLALYQQRFLQSGPPDVLIVGSSRALRGIDPSALQNALLERGYRGAEVFNFGINGATAQVIDLLIRRVLKPDQLPKLIIWADGARAFNSGREDVTYQAIAASEGYQHLTDGTFPSASEVNQRDHRSGETPQASGTLSATYKSMDDWLNQSLAKLSVTYSQRDQLKSLLREQFAAILNGTHFPQDQTLKDAQQLLADKDSVDFDGFLPMSIRFNPATYYKQHPRVSGDYDGDYESFKLGGEQETALESLLQFSRNHNMGIVFVNLPVTKDYLDPVRMEYEKKFQSYMRAFASEKGLIFRDLTQLLLTKPDYFSDPSHLNRYGADQVSTKLAQDPMIPWPSK